jgi:membrane-bound serine protease (ClpP class)
MATVAILIGIGAVLLVLETVLPGMIAGLAGCGCLIAAVVVGYVDHGPATGNAVLLVVVVGLILGTGIWMKYFPGSRFAGVFVSRSAVGNLGLHNESLLHQTGVAQTNLRPSGTALIGRRRVDVVTEGPMIERGTPIRVVAVEGMRVVVRST